MVVTQILESKTNHLKTTNIQTFTKKKNKKQKTKKKQLAHEILMTYNTLEKGSIPKFYQKELFLQMP